MHQMHDHGRCQNWYEKVDERHQHSGGANEAKHEPWQFEGKDKCGMGDNNEGCCKTKYQFFKVKDKHLTTGEFTTPAKYFTDVVSFNPTYQTIFLSQLVEIINGSHAPPFHTGVPIYISNCVFRV